MSANSETPTTPDPGDEPAGTEVIELEVRQVGDGYVAEARAPDASFARSASQMAVGLWLQSLRGSLALGRSFVTRAADSPIGRIVGDAAQGVADAMADEAADEVALATRFVEQRLGRVFSVVVPVVVESLDPAELMEHIDVNAILEQVDVNALLEQVDVDALLHRVDVNALLQRVDVDELMSRVDVDGLLADLDTDAFMAELDIEALLERVDVASVAKRARIGELVTESTSDVAGSALDVGRRQAVALDTLLARLVNRLLGRDSDAMPQGPPTLIDDHERPGE